MYTQPWDKESDPEGPLSGGVRVDFAEVLALEGAVCSMKDAPAHRCWALLHVPSTAPLPWSPSLGLCTPCAPSPPSDAPRSQMNVLFLFLLPPRHPAWSPLWMTLWPPCWPPSVYPLTHSRGSTQDLEHSPPDVPAHPCLLGLTQMRYRGKVMS